MKITLITVCFNSEVTIVDTLESVLAQTYENYEYLIIDGKSKDKTVDIVKEYIPKFKGKLKLLSEKDQGLYDAMNKGIKMSTGDIIGILNSDDILANKNVFKRIVEEYDENTDILYSDVIYADSELKNPIRDYVSGENKSLAFAPAHPTMYIRKKVFGRVGLYNLKYKVAADYDFMVRLNKNHCKFQYFKEYTVIMRMGGVSNGFIGYIKGFNDARTILMDNKVKFPILRITKRFIETILQYRRAKKNKEVLKKIINNR